MKLTKEESRLFDKVASGIATSPTSSARVFVGGYINSADRGTGYPLVLEVYALDGHIVVQRELRRRFAYLPSATVRARDLHLELQRRITTRLEEMSR